MVRALAIPEVPGLTTTYFVSLTLDDAAGKRLSSNFYWLSTKPDLLDWDKTEWFDTPTKSFADLTALQGLPPVDLKLAASSEEKGPEGISRVVVQNPTRNLAFMVHLEVTKGQGGEEILPILWEDNYFSLLPGDKREVTATYKAGDLGGATPVVHVDGWNIQERSQ